MDETTKAPGGANKDSREIIKNLPKHQKAVAELLLKGGRHSAADISRVLGYSDPRGHIRSLRNKGLNIRDEWINGGEGVRYKVYFVPRFE